MFNVYPASSSSFSLSFTSDEKEFVAKSTVKLSNVLETADVLKKKKNASSSGRNDKSGKSHARTIPHGETISSLFHQPPLCGLTSSTIRLYAEHLQNLGPAPLIFVKNQMPRGWRMRSAPLLPEASPFRPAHAPLPPAGPPPPPSPVRGLFSRR